MVAPEGHCWLCNKLGKLTREHIPPEAAFNDCPLLLQKIDELSSQTGTMAWADADRFSNGLYFRSLCERCNNRYGSIYGESYVYLVRQIAERIGNVQDFHRISILGVRRPLRILKQVVLQFVTANGPNFVRANSWVAPFIRDKANTTVPREVGIYVFASNRRGSRKSGVAAHIDLETGGQKIVAEFSFWPLGTVLSWGELEDPRLTPIHHWVRFPFNHNATVDLHLSVNPIASAYPLDFRNEVDILREETADVEVKRPNEEASRALFKEALARSGTDEKDWVFSGHPNTMRKVTDQ